MVRPKQAIELQRSLFSFHTGGIPPCRDQPGLNAHRRLCYTCPYAERNGGTLFCCRHKMTITVRDKYGLKEWKQLREVILARDRHRCRLCGAGEYLHIHHRDGDRTNDAPDNLITLCERCHSRVHAHRTEAPAGPPVRPSGEAGGMKKIENVPDGTGFIR